MPPKSKSKKSKKFFKSKASKYQAWSKDSAIGRTLCYRSIFKYPMSYYQLSQFLISSKSVSHNSLVKELKQAVAAKKVRVKDGHYYLPNTGVVSWEVRFSNSKNLLIEMEPVFKTLEAIPWIKMLAVTGSVAAFNAIKDDDVDIFIVTQKNRVWLTRLFVVLFLKILGKYRTEKHPHGKICPNIYIDETNLKWKDKDRNLYVAHEIAMMHPIINRDNTYFKFIRANSWVFGYFGNFKVNIPARFALKKQKNSGILNLLEIFLMRLQLRYMEKNKTTEFTGKHMIHFNKNDYTSKILGTYKAIVS